MLLLNLGVTLAPLFFSSGSVLIIARIYEQRCSRCTALCAISAWCACQMCTGLALLLFVHSLQRTERAVTYVAVPALLCTWLVVGFALYARHYAVAVLAAALNFCAHAVVVGLALTNSGLAAALLAVVGSVWICWTLCFALSIMLFVRRRLMKPFSDHVLDKMRNDALQLNVRRRQAQQAKNV